MSQRTYPGKSLRMKEEQKNSLKQNLCYSGSLNVLEFRFLGKQERQQNYIWKNVLNQPEGVKFLFALERRTSGRITKARISLSLFPIPKSFLSP